jgi:hypothetical protein
MLAHIRRAVTRTTRRRKPAPVEPAPPLQAPDSKLFFDVDDAALGLAKAVRSYATAPDNGIPAGLRADYAAGIALNAFVELLVGLHINLDPNPDLLALEVRGRVLQSLIVNYGLQSLLSNAATLAELHSEPPQMAVYDRAEQLAAWVHDSAHLALFNTD